MQHDVDCIFCIVDYHAITVAIDPQTLKQASVNMAIDLVASGISPEKAILFVQADNHLHTELAWILGSVTSYGDLSRMTQFKDKSGKQEFVSAALHTYPVLQAADILIYKADGVPIGEDQMQHLELARRIARRFNSRYGTTFPEPETVVGTKGARIMSLTDPTSKMSKSAAAAHTVGVMEEEISIRKKVRSAVTDMGLEAGDAMSPGVANLFEILELAVEETGETGLVQKLRDDFSSGTLMYSKLKDAVFEQLMGVLRPIQQRREKLVTSGDIVDILKAGAAKARIMAQETMSEVRKLVGLGTD
jgi:tryptophanyl-tRNA synthetase